VISNVSLSVPYENLVSLEQIVLAAKRNREYDDVNDTLMKAGDMMSEEEILKLQQNKDPNMEGIMKPSKRWMRLKRRESRK